MVAPSPLPDWVTYLFNDNTTETMSYKGYRKVRFLQDQVPKVSQKERSTGMDPNRCRDMKHQHIPFPVLRKHFAGESLQWWPISRCLEDQ